mmetsp:Transcript_32177/g.78781  ORF Transcript_32177/g.78781 Transcript_32177/m.78781 type:complete len:235 (+) Transcript_32177:88-792(+)
MTDMDMDVEEKTGGAGPNQTIYVRNLNEKVKKAELRRALYAAFTRYGRVLDVVALKTLKMRGQAFVVFADVASATSAMSAMQGFEFYGKPMVVQYARAKSDKVAKLDGTYIPRGKRPQTGKEATANGTAAGEAAKKAKSADSRAEAAVKTMAVDDTQPPNKILFVQNLPPDSTAADATELFKQFAGFVEVRAVPGNSTMVFVEFATEPEASTARSALQGFKYLNHAMAISYAKQ